MDENMCKLCDWRGGLICEECWDLWKEAELPNHFYEGTDEKQLR